MKGIIPANIIEDHGVLTSYYAPDHRVRTNANVIIGSEVVPKRDEHCLLSIDMVTRELDGAFRVAECMDVKLITLTDQTTGEQQGAQMWVFAGTKDTNGFFTPLQLLPNKPSLVFWNQYPFTKFSISIPGVGAPHTFHEFYDRSLTIQTWFSEGGAKFFWQVKHEPPRIFKNDHWSSADQQRQCLYYEEAFWSDSDWFETGGWEIGSGEVEESSGPFGKNKGLPTANNVMYGGFETRAKDTAAIWWASRWTDNENWDEYAMEPA